MKNCRVIQAGKVSGRFLLQSTASYTQMLNMVMDLHYRNFLMGGCTVTEVYGCQYIQDKNSTSFLTFLSFLIHLKELGFHHETRENLFSFSHVSLGLNYFFLIILYSSSFYSLSVKIKVRFQIIGECS